MSRATSATVQLSRDDRVALRTVKGLLAVLIFGQRLAIPLGGGYISPTLPIVLIACVMLYRRRILVEDRTRTLAYVGAAALCLATGLLSFIVGLPDTSLNSLLLLVVMYAPFCLVFGGNRHHLYRPMLVWLNKVLLALAIVAIVQFTSQLAGIWTFQDLFAAVVPQHFIVTGFQPAYPISYGSPLVKSDGIFFVEASVCSQFMALGLIIQLLLREKQWRVLVFGAALLFTVSGTGLVLLAVGLVVQMVRRGFRWSMRVVLVMAAAAGLAMLTPAGRASIGRVSEFGYADTSGHQRFLSPYARMWTHLGDGPRALLIGSGPGSGDREDARILAQTGLTAVSPPVPKLLTEYGLFAGLAFAAAVVALLTVRTPSPTLSGVLLTFFFILSSNLLFAQTVYICWLLASAFGRPRRAAARGVRPAWAS